MLGGKAGNYRVSRGEQDRIREQATVPGATPTLYLAGRKR